MEIELPDGTVLDAPDDADPSVVAKAYLAKQAKPAPAAAQVQAEPQGAKLGAWPSALVRPLAKAVAAPALWAMDAGVGTRNAITGENYEHPSAMFNRALDTYTTAPEGVGKAAEIVSTMVAGAGMAGPTVGRQAPAILKDASQLSPQYAGVAPRQLAPRVNAGDRAPTMPQLPVQPTVRELTLANARASGYVVPPSSAKPTVRNRILESFGGKDATAQDAAIRNQPITQNAARAEVGIAEEAQITKEALAEIRKDAAPAYEAVRKAGTLASDTKYKVELAAATAKFRSVAKDFPKLAKNDIEDIVKEVGKDSFDADSAVSAIGLLRDKASTAYAGGDKVTAGAYRKVSDAMENLIERSLASRGADGAGMLKEFRAARTLMAKTHSIEKALNEGSGNVAALKLGQQLARGKPLTGGLRKAGEFAQAFPKAAREVVDSGAVRNTDVAVGAGSAALSGQPWYLLYPFARMAMRNALLSETVQNSLIQQSRGIPNGLATGAVPLYPEIVNQLR